MQTYIDFSLSEMTVRKVLLFIYVFVKTGFTKFRIWAICYLTWFYIEII